MAAAIVLLSGCSLTHDTNLILPPAVDRPQAPSATVLRMKIVVRDMRPDKSGIGTAYSSVDPTSRFTVKSRQPLESVVDAAITSEFQARGFVVRDADAATTLAVDVTKADSLAKWFLGHTKVRADAELSVRVTNKMGRLLYTNTFAQSKDATNVALFGSYDEGKEQLEAALAEVIRSIPDDPKLIATLYTARR